MILIASVIMSLVALYYINYTLGKFRDLLLLDETSDWSSHSRLDLPADSSVLKIIVFYR